MTPRAKVLVIDDEEDVRLVVRRSLEREGMEVDEAGTGVEGLRALFATRPDVVVLDLEMPVLDGWETLLRLRELSDDVGVLVLSGHDATDQRVRGLREGADDFLGKPYEPRELVARVEALVRRVQTPPEPEQPRIVDTGWLQIDLGSRQARAGGRRVDVSALEMRLLEALARQAGPAVHNVRLTADLQRSRERLVTAREEERRRLRRDLHDGLGPALASQGLKLAAAKQLLQHDPAAAAPLLDDVMAQTQATGGGCGPPGVRPAPTRPG